MAAFASTPAGPILIRAPDHLGDGVMALPAITALAQATPAWVEGPPWTSQLYGHLPLLDARPGQPAHAVLFKPSLSAAWAARHVPARTGLALDGRWPLLTQAVVPGCRHRVEDYRRIAETAGVTCAGLPEFPVGTAPGGVEIRPDTVLLLPGTASRKTAGWTGYRELADNLARQGRPILFAGGPEEADWLPELAGPHPVLPTPGLSGFAWVAAQAAMVVGNDSGLTHLAVAARRAAGEDTHAVHVVHGSTDPARTGPPGATPHQGPRPSCWPCYKKRCPFGAPCLAVNVDLGQ